MTFGKKTMVNVRVVLETLFNRGFAHGASDGMSEDGETYAVLDTESAIKKLILSKKKDMKLLEQHASRMYLDVKDLKTYPEIKYWNDAVEHIANLFEGK